jgi:hypothetical protein
MASQTNTKTGLLPGENQWHLSSTSPWDWHIHKNSEVAFASESPLFNEQKFRSSIRRIERGWHCKATYKNAKGGVLLQMQTRSMRT